MRTSKVNCFYRRIFLAVILLMVSVTSCNDDLLNQDNPNKLTPNNFWRNAEDANKGVIGAYSPLTPVQSFGRMLPLLTVYRSDAADPLNNPGIATDATAFAATSSFTRLQENWAQFYKVVNRANAALTNIANIEMDEEEKQKLMGEAYFLRAFSYFYLINLWHNVPLITEFAESLEETEVEQADPEQVWQQIISDLQEAQSRLPESWDESSVGRATQGAATALLGKTYLYRQEFDLASQEFRKVMDSGNYGLVDNYQDNFTETNENNEESLFEIQLQDSEGLLWGADIPGNARGASFEPDFAPPGFTSQRGLVLNDWILDAFLEEQTISGEIDPRAFATLLWDNPDVTVYGQPFQQAFSSNRDLIGVRKYLYFEDGRAQSAFFDSPINWREIRFADVLLMYAEAENEVNGATSQAYDAINRVRARADMPAIAPGLSQDAMRSRIRNERVLELSLEGSRYFDLLRWGLIPERFTNNLDFKENAGGIQAYEPGREYLPIPQTELDTNPLIEQNPGY